MLGYRKSGGQCEMPQATETYYQRDFWAEENLKYETPHFRLEKSARILNKLARGRQCDLLDVGCGPATLAHLLNENIRYYGIDIAIHNPAPNLLESDFAVNPIAFRGKCFDIIVAQGVFEYIGKVQAQKFEEISQLLNEGGKFLVSYVNFDHRNRNVYWPYNNIQLFDDFRKSLQQFFHIDSFFPTSQRWHHDEPRKPLMKAVQMHINVNIPFVSRRFAVEHFFICSPRARAI
jgi:cyclopropane fatty-acyl-phospholipid synthase-like methyltransferase